MELIRKAGCFLLSLILLSTLQVLPVHAAVNYPTVLMIGDSYALTSLWPEKTAEKTGMERYAVSALGGSGFAASGEDNGTLCCFEDLFERACGEMSNPAYLEWIIVEGGFNDHDHSDEEVLIAVEEFALLAKELCPYAVIAVGMNGWHTGRTDVQNALSHTADLYRQACEDNGLLFIEDLTGCLNNQGDVFLEDGFHPSPAGGEVLAEVTGSWLKVRMEEQNKFERSENMKGLAVNLAVLGGIFVISYIVLRRKNQKTAEE